MFEDMNSDRAGITVRSERNMIDAMVIQTPANPAMSRYVIPAMPNTYGITLIVSSARL